MYKILKIKYIGTINIITITMTDKQTITVSQPISFAVGNVILYNQNPSMFKLIRNGHSIACHTNNIKPTTEIYKFPTSEAGTRPTVTATKCNAISQHKVLDTDTVYLPIAGANICITGKDYKKISKDSYLITSGNDVSALMKDGSRKQIYGTYYKYSLHNDELTRAYSCAVSPDPTCYSNITTQNPNIRDYLNRLDDDSKKRLEEMLPTLHEKEDTIGLQGLYLEYNDEIDTYFDKFIVLTSILDKWRELYLNLDKLYNFVDNDYSYLQYDNTEVCKFLNGSSCLESTKQVISQKYITLSKDIVKLYEELIEMIPTKSIIFLKEILSFSENSKLQELFSKFINFDFKESTIMTQLGIAEFLPELQQVLQTCSTL